MLKSSIVVLCLSVAKPSALPAQEPMSGADFEAFSSGLTLYFSQHGEHYGTEQFLPGRQSVWAFSNDECTKGNWYEDDGLICFVYEHDPTPQCWSFFETDDGFSARAEDGLPVDDLKLTHRDTKPIFCKGPDVGV